MKTLPFLSSAIFLSLAAAHDAFAQHAEVGQTDGTSTTSVVHVEADAPVTLERRQAGAHAWAEACIAPCDAALPLQGAYRIAGSHVRSSAPFYLNAASGERIVLRTSTTSKGAFTAGLVVASVGGGAVILGGALLSYAWLYKLFDTVACSGSGGSRYGTACTVVDGLNTTGLVMLGVGAATAVVGVVILLSNAHSTVHQSSASAGRRQDTSFAGSIWAEEKMERRSPTAFSMPLFAATF